MGTRKVFDGGRFGKWTIIRQTSKYPKVKYLCKCDCGTEKEINGATITSGDTTQCQKCRVGQWSVFEDLTGQKFGRWTVIKRTKNRGTNVMFECQCECGIIGDVSTGHLKGGKSVGCRECRDFHNRGNKNKSWKGYGEITGQYVSAMRKGAEKRGLEFSVDAEYLWKLLEKQEGKCAISGDKIVITNRRKGIQGNMSVDRIDNTKGYIKGNLRWILCELNWMRSNMTQEKFYNMCKKVVEAGHG